jgi:hypothetical protein
MIFPCYINKDQPLIKKDFFKRRSSPMSWSPWLPPDYLGLGPFKAVRHDPAVGPVPPHRTASAIRNSAYALPLPRFPSKSAVTATEPKPQTARPTPPRGTQQIRTAARTPEHAATLASRSHGRRQATPRAQPYRRRAQAQRRLWPTPPRPGAPVLRIPNLRCGRLLLILLRWPRPRAERQQPARRVVTCRPVQLRRDAALLRRIRETPGAGDRGDHRYRPLLRSVPLGPVVLVWP